MPNGEDKYLYADRLINGLMKSETDLNDLFTKRLIDLGMSQRGALAELDIELRALKGLLNGTQKMIDLLALSRLATFLQMPIEKLVNILLDKLERTHLQIRSGYTNQDFIIDNFDLIKLKKGGFIDNTNDFAQIEKKILDYFGIKSIHDYGKDSLTIAYSDGKPKANNMMMRSFWIASATTKLKFINNPYEYNRNKLIEYIPSIRWQTRNVSKGLYQVVRELFKLGVTVIFEPYVSTLYARGATFSIYNKPCIVITNYSSFLPLIMVHLSTRVASCFI